MDFDQLVSGPSSALWPGSDLVGRYTLAGPVVGPDRASGGSGAVGLGVLVGRSLDLLALYGRIDDALVRLIDAPSTFPAL